MKHAGWRITVTDYGMESPTITEWENDMQLEEIREEINGIDADMKELFELRMQQSEKIALVKLENKDEVYKPMREKEMLEGISPVTERWYGMYLRKLVEISRKYQYSVIIEKEQEDKGFIESLSKENREALLRGGRLALTLQTDENGAKGLPLSGVLSIISGTNLLVEHLVADGTNGRIRLTLQVNNTAQARNEAYLLAYMLYKETLSVTET